MPKPQSPSPRPSDSASGGLAAAAAFVTWGLMPLYWRALHTVPALEILCHRIVWSLLAVFAALACTGRLGEARRAMSTKRETLLLLASSLLIAANWFAYIWAVNHDRVLESSLGYFINPLVNVLLGSVFYRERPRRLQAVAILLAAAGVAVPVLGLGHPPWIALFLGFSFGFYGLCRKLMRVEALPGLFVETLVLSIPAGAWLGWLALHGQGALLHQGRTIDALLVLAGVFTSAPLAAFAYGARRIRLATLGIIQYLGPTGMFLLGAFAWNEPLDSARLASFGLIWAAIALYTTDALLVLRAAGRPRG